MSFHGVSGSPRRPFFRPFAKRRWASASGSGDMRPAKGKGGLYAGFGSGSGSGRSAAVMAIRSASRNSFLRPAEK